MDIAFLSEQWFIQPSSGPNNVFLGVSRSTAMRRGYSQHFVLYLENAKGIWSAETSRWTIDQAIVSQSSSK
jgi:hypothetical protein